MLISSIICNDKERLSKNEIIIKGILFYIKSILILIPLILLMIGILNLFNINTESLKYLVASDIKEFRTKGVLYMLFIVVCFGPFFEELTFRLGLSFKRKHISISTAALVYLIGSFLSDTGYFDYIQYKFPVAVLAGLLVYILHQQIFDSIQRKYGRLIIWISILFFGFLHVLNFDIVADIWPLYFIMCLPQVAMGIVLVYYRLNLGFLYALAFHVVLNGISFFISFKSFLKITSF